jgi:SAM-dependent methyltransferase
MGGSIHPSPGAAARPGRPHVEKSGADKKDTSSKEDPFFAPYDRAFWTENGSEAHRAAEYRIARALFSLTTPDRVLDVGCGTAQMLHELQLLGAIVQGIESAPGIAWCQKLGILEVAPHLVIAQDLRAPDLSVAVRGEEASGPFDLVVCVEVLEHLPEISARELVRQICEVVRPTWIALSGALPHSPGGTGHINEQRTIYWISLVESFGTHELDPSASDELHRRSIGSFTWADQVNLYRRIE